MEVKISRFFLSVCLLLIVCVALAVISYMIQIRKQANRDKLSPYECGFQPLMSARVSFSLRFYLIMIMFVIFDVEVILMIPVLFVLYGSKDVWSSFGVFLFVLTLILGVLYERRDGSMDWSLDSKSWTGQKM